MIKNLTLSACLILAGLQATGCATVETQQLVDPQTTVDVMRHAFSEDESSLFLHCLSRSVLSRYSEHVIRVGWSDIRPSVGEFVEHANVIEIEDYDAEKNDPLVPEDFVWPTEGAQLKRVTLRVENDTEDFLFEREVDDPPADAKQARGFWIGDQYIVRTEHDSPQTYQDKSSPESERVQWRLVFPYHPFQANGALTAKLQSKMANAE
ncbi:hypothetical protein OAU50_06680 [Planctomycetota bacterium]|nr:hypothetical protein [Planctomycetota bacterium]